MRCRFIYPCLALSLLPSSGLATFLFPSSSLNLSVNAQDSLVLDYQTRFAQVNVTLFCLLRPTDAVDNFFNLEQNPVAGSSDKVTWPSFQNVFDGFDVDFPLNCFFRLTQYLQNGVSEDSAHFTVEDDTAAPAKTWTIANAKATQSSIPKPSASSEPTAAHSSALSSPTVKLALGLVGSLAGVCGAAVAVLLWRQRRLSNRLKSTQAWRAELKSSNDRFAPGHAGLHNLNDIGHGGGKWWFGKPVYESDGTAVLSDKSVSSNKGWSDGRTNYVVAHELTSESMRPELNSEAERKEMWAGNLRQSKVEDVNENKKLKSSGSNSRVRTSEKDLPPPPGWV